MSADEICEKCGKNRLHAGGGCIHCITEWCKDRVREARTERDELSTKLAAAQARIDELMLEFCPDEMTPEQLANWAAHQRAVPESELPEELRKP